MPLSREVLAMGGQAFAVRSLDAGATGDEEGRTAEWLGQIPVWCAPGTRWRVRLCHWPFKTYRAALTVGRKQPADVRSRASPVPRERVAGKWHLCGPYAPEAGPNPGRGRAEASPKPARSRARIAAWTPQGKPPPSGVRLPATRRRSTARGASPRNPRGRSRSPCRPRAASCPPEVAWPPRRG